MSNLRNQPPKVLIMAHVCRPDWGSEAGSSWKRAVAAASEFETWVICEQDFCEAAIRRYCSQHGAPANLHFIFLPHSGFEQILQRLPGVFYYPAYQLWLRRAYKAARQLHATVGLNLLHQLSFNGFRFPGYPWKIDAALVWGPIGGAQNYPWRFLTHAGVRGAVKETIRSLINSVQLRFSRKVGKAARKASVLLAASRTNARALAARSRTTPRVMMDVGVDYQPHAVDRSFRHGGPLRLLWAGVFEHRKALHLLLEAVARLPKSTPYELRIIGDGELKARWKKMAQRLGIEPNCRWLGWLSHADTLQQYQWADLFVFTSLRDTTGTVLLEAMAAGTPVVCLDHQGAADIVTDHSGVKLPVTTPRQAIGQFAQTLARLHQDRNELERLSQGAVGRAADYAWNNLGARMLAVYREVLGVDRATRPAGEPPLDPADEHQTEIPRGSNGRSAAPMPGLDEVIA